MYFYKNEDAVRDLSLEMDFPAFLRMVAQDSSSWNYGNYEYFAFDDGNISSRLFGTVFKKITWNEPVVYDVTYEDGTHGERTYYQRKYAIVYRRPLDTLDGEVLRYAHSCKYDVWYVYDQMVSFIKRERAAGRTVPPDYLADYQNLRSLMGGKFASDPKTIFAVKKVAMTLVEKHKLHWYYYEFVSPFMSDEEKEFVDSYAGKAKDDYYYWRRDQLHMEYFLAGEGNKSKVQGKIEGQRNRVKTTRTLFIIFAIVFVVSLIGDIISLVASGYTGGEAALPPLVPFFTVLLVLSVFPAVVFLILTIIFHKRTRVRK